MIILALAVVAVALSLFALTVAIQPTKCGCEIRLVAEWLTEADAVAAREAFRDLDAYVELYDGLLYANVILPDTKQAEVQAFFEPLTKRTGFKSLNISTQGWWQDVLSRRKRMAHP